MDKKEISVAGEIVFNTIIVLDDYGNIKNMDILEKCLCCGMGGKSHWNTSNDRSGKTELFFSCKGGRRRVRFKNPLIIWSKL